jgi:adenosylhomocysteine nucleosidase
MATADVETLLLVAAEGREFAGILRNCRHRTRLRWPVRFARSAELGGLRLFLVANGCGAALAGEACEVAWNKQRTSAIVSTGFCGALDPMLGVGDVFVAARVESPDGTVGLDASVPECSRPHSTGRLVSADHVVQTVEEKRELRGRGASAVEMEALAVALRAKHWGVPFYCVRAVTDLAEEGFQLDFNAARDGEGRLSTARILWAVARRPDPLASELLRLYHRSHLAVRALGAFFADCGY